MMPIDPERLLKWKIPDVVESYTRRDVALYALGIGLGLDPADSEALRYVVDPERTLPTFATVIGQQRDWFGEPDLGLDVASSVHGEQRLVLQNPLPVEATVVDASRVIDLVDKGAGRGAIVVTECALSDAVSGAPYATMQQSVFFRRDGGFGGKRGNSAGLPEAPAREPDLSIRHPTSRQTALIYRLSGDRNPLHSNPDVAVRAGFERPILHGLASFGIAANALIRSLPRAKPSALRSIACRFTAPVYPGDTLETQLWREGKFMSFRVRCAERGVIVADRGRAELAL